MAKTLQARPKRVAGQSRKKPKGPVTNRPRAKAAKKPTLREFNRWFSQNHEQILSKAKQNCLRLTGRETL